MGSAYEMRLVLGFLALFLTPGSSAEVRKDLEVLEAVESVLSGYDLKVA